MTNTKKAIYRTADEKTFEFFCDARRHAAANGLDVFQIDNGLRRWTPGNISTKAQKRYHERLAAYKAQEKAKNQ